MNSMIAYGFLLVLLLDHVHERGRRVALILGGIAVIAAIGFSRVYLGVHFLTDVVGGWLAGAAWLIVGIAGYRFAQHRFARRQSM